MDSAYHCTVVSAATDCILSLRAAVPNSLGTLNPKKHQALILITKDEHQKWVCGGFFLMVANGQSLHFVQSSCFQLLFAFKYSEICL